MNEVASVSFVSIDWMSIAVNIINIIIIGGIIWLVYWLLTKSNS